jgi:DNA replication protein DnaC
MTTLLGTATTKSQKKEINMSHEELLSQLRRLGLTYLAAHMSDFIAQMTKGRLSPQQLIEELVRCESEERQRKGLARRVAGARLGRYRPLSEFDWSWPKNLRKDVIDHLLKLSFVAEPANVILVGPSGTGKTTIAKNLAYEAIIAGRNVLFTEAADMLTDLEQQESPRALKLRLQRYIKPDILVIDEVGYLSYTARAGDLMFQVINKRHEKSSTILTTNVAFKDWPQIFPGAACVVALIDRLTHRAEIVPVEGASYRMREASDRAKKSLPSPKKEKP